MARLSYPTRYDPSRRRWACSAASSDRSSRPTTTSRRRRCRDSTHIGAMGSVLSDGVTPDGVFNPHGPPRVPRRAAREQDRVRSGADGGDRRHPRPRPGPGDRRPAGCPAPPAPASTCGPGTSWTAPSPTPGRRRRRRGRRRPAAPRTIRARKGVIFTSGGFFHNEAMRTLLLRGTVWGSHRPVHQHRRGADDRRSSSGAMTENTDSLLVGPDGGRRGDGHPAHATRWPSGSTATAWCMVNRYGVRVVNEKAHYNERGPHSHRLRRQHQAVREQRAVPGLRRRRREQPGDGREVPGARTPGSPPSTSSSGTPGPSWRPTSTTGWPRSRPDRRRQARRPLRRPARQPPSPGSTPSPRAVMTTTSSAASARPSTATA